jgi:hypothetical protein
MSAFIHTHVPLFVFTGVAAAAAVDLSVAVLISM